MLIKELFGNHHSRIGARDFAAVQVACEQFIKESNHFPVYKQLPKSYNDFHRVKVRQQKRSDNVTAAFNKAFEEFSNLRQRAVFTTPSYPVCEGESDLEPFYVFPVNGYKYLYSREVRNSRDDYKQVVDTLFEQFDDDKEAFDIVTNLLKFTYTKTNLTEGISSGSEIIFYGIPYYYAIRVNAVPSYNTIITT